MHFARQVNICRKRIQLMMQQFDPTWTVNKWISLSCIICSHHFKRGRVRQSCTKTTSCWYWCLHFVTFALFIRLLEGWSVSDFDLKPLMWWKKSPCPDNDVTGEAENFSDYPRISVNKNNISCLLGGCNCPFLLAKCLSCWHRCWILFPLFNKRGNNYSRMERQRKV